MFHRLTAREIRVKVPGFPDDEQSDGHVGARHRFHVLASWRLEDGGAYVYTGSTLSTSSAAAERWAREQVLLPHDDRGEPDVVSVTTYDEWEQAVEDVRRRIGE